MDNKSEVARLRAEIDREIEALHQLKYGFARCASHESIMSRYRALDRHYAELVPYVGEEVAIATICERIEELL